MIGGYLDQDDPDAVRILDPHLGQAPGLGLGSAQNASAGRGEPLVLGGHVPHLEPDHHRSSGSASTGSVAGHFQKSRAEKEHHPALGGRPELPVDRQTQHVPVEMLASVQVGGPQQNAAAQYVHATILAGRLVRPPQHEVVRARRVSCPGGRRS